MVSHRVVNDVGDGSAKEENIAREDASASRPPRRGCLVSCISFLGVASLCYLFGAAVMYFKLPTATFLSEGFLGGVALYEQLHESPPSPESQPPISVGKIDKADKTCDGFTLCLCSGGPRARLIDMRANSVHDWYTPFKTVWLDLLPHLSVPVNESDVYYNDAHLYPNGDLLVLVEGPGNSQNLAEHYGLVKMDKDSRVLWKYAAGCHHALDVAEDGTIYALSYEFVKKVPPGLEHIPTPCIADCVDVISPEGKQIRRISLLDAFKDSPYAPLLSTLQKPQLFRDVTAPEAPMQAAQDEMRRRDVLHTNTVKVLSRSLASKFPLFKPGHLLISPRHLDTIAVLDPDSGKIVWATHGPWHAQHDPSFLDNGHLLLFDNLGSAKGSRVLEYDPNTQSFPWWYPDDNATPFFSRIRGVAQRLTNGNTLIVNSDDGEVFEVTPSREVVWTCSCGKVTLNCARRYLPQQLTFLKGDRHARP